VAPDRLVSRTASIRRVVVSVLLVVDYLFKIVVASICAGLVAACLCRRGWSNRSSSEVGSKLDELFDPEQPGR
jgi:hypothetical protein